MALITTTASLIRQYNAFTGLSATERSQSGIARAEVVYYNVNDDWPATGASDNRLYQTGIVDLPLDFGYVLTDARIKLENANTSGIAAEAVAHYTLYPGGILGPQINGFMDSKASRADNAPSTAIGSIRSDRYNTMFPSNTGAIGAIVYELDNQPSALLYPFGSNAYTSASNPATSFNFAIAEQPFNQTAARVSVYLRFLQYDIDQSYNYVVQSPQLTR